MRFAKELALRNMKRKPVRTAALIILAAFLAFSVFAGTMIVMSLQRGLESYQTRLGADIVAVPFEARTKGSLDSILLQGIPGYFYMDSQYYEKIKNTSGVEVATPQFYLASASAGCCSIPVQIIGFEPETDFLIQPWISRSYSGTVGDGDVIVGSDISVPLNHQLRFYDTDCNVVAQLDRTGTGLDTAVYANMNTIKQMMKNAQALGFHNFDGINADKVVSSVMIKVAEGYTIENVANDINIHVRHIEATPAKSMISGIGEGLSNVSGIIGILTVMIWILAIVILMIAFVMIANERTKEFAVLRVVGASRKMLVRILRTESALISVIGAAIGAGAGCLMIFPFAGAMRTRLGLPYLLPSAGVIIGVLIGAIAISVFAGWMTSYISARKIAGNETGLILREDA
ncbi:MAG: FtsX-like permease family protein [Firmicutes bacterium]|nr:FtsX-like permease family protein [Bacillota bacterium]